MCVEREKKAGFGRKAGFKLRLVLDLEFHYFDSNLLVVGKRDAICL